VEAADIAGVALFAILFAGVWVAVTVLLGHMSGWPALARAFPDEGDDEPIVTLTGESGVMGRAVSLQGILALGACRSGLRVSINRLFGPFSRPFLAPWYQIAAEPTAGMLAPRVKLRFGQPEVATLTIDAGTWDVLKGAVEGRNPEVVAAVSTRQFARRLALQWLLATALGTGFFFLATRVGPRSDPAPLSACILVPAILFGVIAIVRFRLSRPRL
jgi:hypothetical protein